jgi:hypothetical protein
MELDPPIVIGPATACSRVAGRGDGFGRDSGVSLFLEVFRQTLDVYLLY